MSLKLLSNEWLKRERKAASSNSMLATSYKLVGNSFYGGMLMNKDRHSQVHNTNSHIDLMRSVNRPFFMNNTVIKDDVIEVEEVRQKMKQNVPIQLGKFILEHAKARMAMFYKDILGKYCDSRKYALISTDTDSFTLALAVLSYLCNNCVNKGGIHLMNNQIQVNS